MAQLRKLQIFFDKLLYSTPGKCQIAVRFNR
jgi:hypothetical protein